MDAPLALPDSAPPPTPRGEVRRALRTLDGSATVGDVVAATGQPADDVRAALKELLERHDGHLEVTDSGELRYRFDPRFLTRDREPLLDRLRRAAWAAFRAGFKVWIVAMLVVYFFVFVALILAAIFAGDREGRGGGWGGRRGGHRHLPLGDLGLLYWIWGPRWRIGRPYYGHRWERTLPKEDRVPFYKKVFAFVFGPDRPEPTRAQLDRSILRLIRAREGVLSTPELVEHTGLPLPEAESEMARLMGAYDGEPVVSPDGRVLYAFPGLVTSAHGRVRSREPAPAWRRLEPPRELTGNTKGADAAIVAVNGFNLVAAATAPLFIFPRLGMGGPAAWIGLVLIPVVFSLLFFLVPGLRMLGVARENRRRERRNVRRVMLGWVHREARAGRSVDQAAAVAHVQERLGADVRGEAVRALEALAAEYGAEVEAAGDGTFRYRFPEVPAAFREAAAVRRRLALADREQGPVVFSTADDAAAEGRRELEAWDRELRDGTPPPLPDVDRIGYEPEYELVAFEEELAARAR